MNKCDFCQNAVGLVGATVDCKFYQKTIVVPEYCAAQILTSEGWENAAEKAKQRGDIKQANSYYERAIQLQTPIIG